jgi:hypothetical protein
VSCVAIRQFACREVEDAREHRDENISGLSRDTSALAARISSPIAACGWRNVALL